jgi:hypothetical protein
MNTIFESRTYDILMDTGKSMIIIHWFGATESWTSEDFMKENLNIVNIVAQHKPTYLLSLSADFLYPIVPDEQIWLVDNVFVPHHQNGIQKMALIMSNDFISQLAIEQLIDETTIVPTGMFATQDDAEKWLLRGTNV